MKTTLARNETVKKDWCLIDADGLVIGKLAVKIADILRGKNKPIYTPHVDTGDFVVVINAEKAIFTGGKEKKKEYATYSGYMGGLKVTTADKIRAKKPEQLLIHAIEGMIPSNRLGRSQFEKLHVYAGKEHPHKAQNPKVLTNI
ncbi:MAG: 50S ribosomal protein L13 [Verrucomicrobiota bacterium]|nr:50S ribosomal protein L13 [Verrucomicrobiota bacterium]